MKTLKIIGNLIYALVVASVVLIAAIVFLPLLDVPVPYSVYSIDSGSMSPTIPVGSLVIVRHQVEYNEGDVITFRQERSRKQVVTHRIVNVERDDDIGKYAFVTKGDANDDPDPEPVPVERVVGKVVVHAPLVGHPVSFAKTKNGFIALVVVPAALIVYQELVNVKTETVRLIQNLQARKSSTLDPLGVPAAAPPKPEEKPALSNKTKKSSVKKTEKPSSPKKPTQKSTAKSKSTKKKPKT